MTLLVSLLERAMWIVFIYLFCCFALVAGPVGGTAGLVSGTAGLVGGTAGLVGGTADENSLKKQDKYRKGFGSQDILSMNVISSLQRVTIALEGAGDVVGMMETNGGRSSQDFSSLDAGGAYQSKLYVLLMLQSNILTA